MKAQAAAVALLCLIAASPCSPCSILAYSEGGTAHFCGNEDWTFKDPALLSRPAAKGEYGYLLLGWKAYLPSYPQAGVNSEGLCFDWASVPGQAYRALYPGRPSLGQDFAVELLARCRDVEEALRYVEGRDIPHLAEEHLFLADASGASCVLEYEGGRIRLIRGEGGRQYVTNFNLTNPSRGWYPCERYAKLKAFFDSEGPKAGRLAEILDATHQEGAYPTVYSYIMDLKRMRLSLYLGHDFGRGVEYSIPELLKKGATSDLASR